MERPSTGLRTRSRTAPMSVASIAAILQSWRARLARSSLVAYLGLHAIAGTALSAALVWAFVALADEIPEGGTLRLVDTALGAWLEAHGTEAGERALVFVSWLGATGLAVVVALALLVLIRRHDWLAAKALAFTSATGLLLGHALKLLFHRGRPETAVEFIRRPSWSFPSGHSLNSMVCYGFLGMLALEHVRGRRPRVAVMTGVIALIVAIGFSRLYLGVHFVTDVIGGWVAGAAWMLVCWSAYHVARRERVR